MPQVSSTCLALQNSYGLDVNLLLFACWHARHRGCFDGELLENALSFSSLWADNVVKPLRGTRTWMKSNEDALWERARPRLRADQTPPDAEKFDKLRQQIKSLELQSEQFQQNVLESLVVTPIQELSLEVRLSAAARNLRDIVEASAVPLNDIVVQSLSSLILHALDLTEDAGILQLIHNELARPSA